MAKTLGPTKVYTDSVITDISKELAKTLGPTKVYTDSVIIDISLVPGRMFGLDARSVLL